MKIDSYQVGMESARTYSSSTTRKLRLQIGGQGLTDSFSDMSNTFNGMQYKLPNEKEKDKQDDSLSEENSTIRDAYESMNTPLSNKIRQINSSNTEKSLENVHQRFILYLWQIFFGSKRANELAEELGFNTSDYNQNSALEDNSATSTISITGVRESYYSESESLSFTSNGTVKSLDGREINFKLDVEMSRSFSAYYREEGIQIPQMCDPLVLNFSGNPESLSDTKFFFDLDNDGNKEEISTLNSESGFLALDKNNDGIINDGSELFGTSSGNGFKDLAKYDNDNNGWIDENDEIFDKLKIWVKDSEGNDTLYSLKEKNVGAIFLGNVDSNYTLMSTGQTNINGAIRKAGIFLYEDGSGAGMINHLDIAN